MINIFPAIDIIEGKCVRLTRGLFEEKTIYNNSPVEVAKEFELYGIKYLHLVDLDGAKNKKIINYKILEQIKKSTSLIVDYGGGINTEEDLKIAFSCGADKVNIGSIAYKSPSIMKKWLEQYGVERFILSADFIAHKNNTSINYNIAISGWQKETATDLFEFINYYSDSIKYISCTDIHKDGTLSGINVDIYRKLTTLYPQINIIASGGISSIKEIVELSNYNLYGVIIGKAIYEGKISLDEIKNNFL